MSAYDNDERVVRHPGNVGLWTVTDDDGNKFDLHSVRDPLGGPTPFFEPYDMRSGRPVLGALGRFDDVVNALIGAPR